jgi:hypothetical protein
MSGKKARGRTRQWHLRQSAVKSDVRSAAAANAFPHEPQRKRARDIRVDSLKMSDDCGNWKEKNDKRSRFSFSI